MLFTQRARTVQARFSITEENIADVVRICQLTEGMPLALELAATWIRTLPCKGIVREIEVSLNFLSTEQHDRALQSRSVRAVFDRSWDLLSDEEQMVFRRLSVFRGRFSLQAAVQVAETSESILTALVNKSLVRWLPVGRYEIHELLRQYGAEKLRANHDEEELTRHQHGQFFIALLLFWLDHLKGAQQSQAVVEIVQEIENVRAAWRWAVTRWPIAEIRAVLTNLWIFYDIREGFHEALTVYTWSAKQLSIADTALAIGSERSIAYWQVESSRGWFLMRAGQFEQSRELLQKCLTELRRLKAWEEVSRNLHFLGVVEWLMGNYLQAQALYKEGIIIEEQSNDSWNMGMFYGCLGLVAISLGEYREAEQLILKGHALFKQLNDLRLTASGLSHLGMVYAMLGDLDEAEKHLHQSLTIARAMRDQWLTPITLNHLGRVAYAKRQYAQARQLHLESLALFEESGDRGQTAVSLCHLGDTSIGLEEYEEARTYFYEALRLAKEVNYVPVELSALAGIATLLSVDGGGQEERIGGLLHLVLSHPASTQETKDKAGQLLSKIAKQAPAETIVAAQDRVAGLDLERIVEELLVLQRDLHYYETFGFLELAACF